MNELFSPASQETLTKSIQVALDYRQERVIPDHIFVALTNQPTIQEGFKSLGINSRLAQGAVLKFLETGNYQGSEPQVSRRWRKVVERSSDYRYSTRCMRIEPYHLLLSVLSQGGSMACGILEGMGLDRNQLNWPNERNFGIERADIKFGTATEHLMRYFLEPSVSQGSKHQVADQVLLIATRPNITLL